MQLILKYHHIPGWPEKKKYDVNHYTTQYYNNFHVMVRLPANISPDTAKLFKVSNILVRQHCVATLVWRYFHEVTGNIWTQIHIVKIIHCIIPVGRQKIFNHLFFSGRRCLRMVTGTTMLSPTQRWQTMRLPERHDSFASASNKLLVNEDSIKCKT